MIKQISRLTSSIKGERLKRCSLFLFHQIHDKKMCFSDIGCCSHGGVTAFLVFSGGPPAERTGNPGEICGNDTCASSCHTSFSVNAGSAQ